VIQNGGGFTLSACVNQRIPKTLSRIPSTPPTVASTSTSVRCCRITRRRLAPSAIRTATSRRRSDARATSRFETLTQAISSTPRPAPSIV
jgi:hypothetical protein